MGASVVSIGQNANRGGAVSGTKNPVMGTISQALRDRLKALFPKQTWTYVEKLLYPGQDRERLVKHRLAGTREFSVDELAALLRSEQGFKFLVDVMADAKPNWWRLCLPLMTAADAQRMQVAARRKIKQALEDVRDADCELTATIERGQAALALQDEEFYSARLAPLSRSGGAPNSAYGLQRRAVAPAGKQKV